MTYESLCRMVGRGRPRAGGGAKLAALALEEILGDDRRFHDVLVLSVSSGVPLASRTFTRRRVDHSVSASHDDVGGHVDELDFRWIEIPCICRHVGNIHVGCPRSPVTRSPPGIGPLRSRPRFVRSWPPVG